MAFGIPGGGPSWNALRLAGPRWAEHVRLVESPVPGHVILGGLESLPGMAQGYLQSVDRQSGQMKVRTGDIITVALFGFLTFF